MLSVMSLGYLEWIEYSAVCEDIVPVVSGRAGMWAEYGVLRCYLQKLKFIIFERKR